MSGVWNREQVNMNSWLKVTLLGLSRARSQGSLDSAMVQM